MCQAHTFGQVLAPGLTSSALVLKPCQREITTDEIQERKLENYRECAI